MIRNKLNQLTARASADPRGKSKQERSGVAPNKDNHVTEYKPKQTNQTENSFQEKHKRWYQNGKNEKEEAADNQCRHDETEERKWFLVLVQVVLCLIDFLPG